MFKGQWLVCDMDGTLVSTPSKAGGHYLDLTTSPCHIPLVRWIRNGGSLCVASTAGRRMFRQIVDVLKPHLRARPNCVRPGQLVVCGFSGAALFTSDAETGEMKEDTGYRMTGGPNGANTGIPPAHLDTAVAIARGILCDFMERADKDDTLIPTLSEKYRKVFPTLLAKRRELGAEEFNDTVYALDKLCLHGHYLSETQDALLDQQYIPDIAERAIVQLTVLGIPMSRYHEFFTDEIVTKLQGFGLYCKKQPNSVVIAHQGIDKATAVRWMVAHPERYINFNLANAFAFGDNPELVDRPLTIFPEMPFVSVSPDAKRDPPGLHYVGSEELGTGRFLSALLEVTACPEYDDAGDEKTNKKEEEGGSAAAPEGAVVVPLSEEVLKVTLERVVSGVDSRL